MLLVGSRISNRSAGSIRGVPTYRRLKVLPDLKKPISAFNSVSNSYFISNQNRMFHRNFSSSLLLQDRGNIMYKTWKIGLCLLVGVGALISSESILETPKMSEPVMFTSIEGKPWIEECVKKYPEVLFLADDKVRHTEEGLAILDGTSSEKLFGHKFIEFDRTIMTLHCLRLIMDGGEKAYEIFTKSQPTNVKLSRESFNALHLQGQKLLKSGWGGLSETQMAQSIETALVLGDIGKSERARALFSSYGIKAPDHDDFYGELMQVLKKHPEICPSFDNLPSSAKTLLIETSNLIHWGHFVHLEGGLEMFSKLREKHMVLEDSTMLSFDFFIYICDVAGALAQINDLSSIVYTEPTYQSIQAMKHAMTFLSNQEEAEMTMYDSYLEKRASWLGLNALDDFDRVLARIGAMLRLFTPEEGVILKKAMLNLDGNTRNKIILHLNIQGKEKLALRTATYMPAVLVNLSKNPNLGSSTEERLAKAVEIGLPFIARALEHYKYLVVNGKIDPSIPLCFNKAAGIAKKSPQLLNEEFFIDRDGNILFCEK